MVFPCRSEVEKVREQYPAGTRVELVKMDDAQAPKVWLPVLMIPGVCWWIGTMEAD